MLKLETWVTERWPGVILHSGWILFGIACLNSARLPVEAMFVGPGMMAAGVCMIEHNKWHRS